MRRFHLSSVLLSDSDKRTIVGTAIPIDESVDLGGTKPYKFALDSVTMNRETVPLLAYHDPNRPVGRMTLSEWTEAGWQTTFKVSATNEGNDILTLSHDGVLGLSIGIDVPSEDDIEETDEFYLIKRANCFEVSVTPTPAFAGASISKVTLSKAVEMPEIEVPQEVELVEGEQTASPDLLTALSRPTPQPIPRTTVRFMRDPYPHLRGGQWNGNSWFRDMALARGVITASRPNDAGYMDRLSESLKFAVTTADLMPQEPSTDTSMTIRPSDPANPLSGIISTRGLPADGGQPFYVPTWTNTGETGLSAPHVEGVEPALGDIGSWTRQLVEPSAVSGKVALTREAVLASTTPDMEALVFARMDVARRAAVEANVGAQLAALTLPGAQVKTIGGANIGDELTAISLDLLYSSDPGRFDTAIVSRNIFADIVNAKGTDGRPLYPILGATNANGTTAPGLRYANVAGVNYYPVAGITGGYMLDSNAVVSWLGPVQEFQFDYEIAWVRLGHFQMQAFAVLDSTGVIRLSYSAA